MKWKILNKTKSYTVEDVITCLLENRGLKTNEEVDEFFFPKLEDVTVHRLGIDKQQLKKAIKRIKKAIKNKESIVVYTDYDVDGICAGAIVWETLYSLGAKVMPHVPHRIDEGYGLTKKGIDHVKKEYNANLIITVDHGIVANKEINYAQEKGIDVIITDHHLAGEKLPKAISVIHSSLLSGSGVAWLLARFLKEGRIAKSKDTVKQLELVALASIADLVPLVGANRTLTKLGLEILNQTDRIGLLSLIDEAGLKLGNIGTYKVGHILAPRINAMGRLSHAIDALRLLCTKDDKRAKELASKLGSANRERQQKTQEMYLQATDLYKENSSKKLIFLHHPHFSEGLIGLIAGKLVEDYYKPAIVVSQRQDYSKGSIRSINGVNIIEILRKHSDLLVDFGGHPLAAGFTIETEKLELFRRRLEAHLDTDLSHKSLTKILKIDCFLPIERVNLKLFNKLRLFEPHGIGNSRPVFVAGNLTITDARLVGREGDHLKLVLSARPDLDIIGFGLSGFFPKLKNTKKADLAFSLDENIWNNQKRLQLKIKDIKIP